MASKKQKHETEYSLEDLLPHRGDMLLLDEILELAEEYALTTATVTSTFPLCRGEEVQPLIMVELAAQTAGVCNGLTRIKDEGEETSRKGWLVGVKRADFSIEAIPMGSRLIIRSENTHKFDILREVVCVVHLEDRLIGEITLQLIQA